VVRGMRRSLHGSALLRVLTELQVAEPAAPGQPFAERLGQWLDFKSALALLAVLDRDATPAEPAAASVAADSAALWEAFRRVRATLAESIAADPVYKPGKPPIELAVSAALPADFAPFHRYYVAHQREMTAHIVSLRANVRAALSRRSPALRRLAALDAVLDQGLAGRESGLLALVPGLLAKRFEALRTAHAKAPADAWQARFCEEVRAVLLAELELRLQPVAGLIAALDNEESTDGE